MSCHSSKAGCELPKPIEEPTTPIKIERAKKSTGPSTLAVRTRIPNGLFALGAESTAETNAEIIIVPTMKGPAISKISIIPIHPALRPCINSQFEHIRTGIMTVRVETRQTFTDLTEIELCD